MQHRLSISFVVACFVILFLACYHSVLFHDQQFGFRDAAHFYYPLYQRVQQEWDAGRIPLWEMEENAGMTLVGNPTAAVFYPLKIIYALFSYPWGARIYVLAHTIIAFATMLVLMRWWKTSWSGSGLAGMAYAFGVPVLFQGSNIIYLVGAAWLPLGIHAVDRWVRCGRRGALIELAIVLSLQLMGGEPQSSYLLGLAGLGYAGGLVGKRAREQRREEQVELGIEPRRLPRWFWAMLAAWLFLLWVAGTLILGCWTPRFRKHTRPSEALPWMAQFPVFVSCVWGLAGLAFLGYWLYGPRKLRGLLNRLGVAWTGLAIAAAVGALVTAIQLLPVMEFTQQSLRAAESSPHDIYPFSMEPLRLAGLIWPDVLGLNIDRDTYWGDLLRMPGGPARVWVPSLYIGILTVVLAAGAFAIRRGSPWRIWLSAIAVISLLASLGQYTSPIWAARALAAGTRWEPLQRLIAHLGPLDPIDTAALREDWNLRDGDGSFYWWLVTFLPGFRQFRYPAKLFTFTTLALAALAGIGWDSVRSDTRRRITVMTATLLAVTAAALAVVGLGRASLLKTFTAANLTSIYGPFDPRGAVSALILSLAQATAVLAAGLAAIRLADRRPALAASLVLLAATADLALANARYVLTIPQSTLETTPEILRVIQQAEREQPSDGPYRVHRLPSWEPMIWHESRSPSRGREIVAWERDTLQPKYGIPFGLEYAHVIGVAELYEYEWYFGGFLWPVKDSHVARLLGVQPGEKVVYFPRRSFDMWNVRYFILPSWPNGWRDSFRGFATMLLETHKIYPPSTHARGPEAEKATRDWFENHDVQVYRNLNEHPRAWVAHTLRRLPALSELRPGRARQVAMQEITFSNDLIWTNPTRNVFDFHNVVWVDPDDHDALIPYSTGGKSRASEAVKIRYPSPQRVELDVDLESAGIVVLADVYYPGWKLTIDDTPAPILRANRIMRGAAVGKGHHRLVYTYEPLSFRIGSILSAAGLGVLLLLGLASYRWPLEPVLASQPEATYDPDL